MSERQALVVVDMQNDFLLPSSPVCVAGGLACVPQVIRAVEIARTSSIPVIWVVRGHHPQGGARELVSGTRFGNRKCF